MHIGKELKERRLNANLSQEKLCELANVTKPTLIKIEKGSNNYNIDKLIQLFDALDRVVKISTQTKKQNYETITLQYRRRTKIHFSRN